MPAKRPKLTKNDKGVYETKGLTETQFISAMSSQVKSEKNNSRRGAKRILTPKALGRRDAGDLVKLGRKEDGTPFTEADLKRFEKMNKRFVKRRAKKTGISYLEVLAKGRSIDVKRANNNVTDGSGISTASFIALKQQNVAYVRVKASNKSKYQEHLVKIRFEDWDHGLMNAGSTDNGYKKAVKNVCRGQVSFDCDCGRYQYWYRYLATIGNYQLSPPKEMAYTKIRNPNLVGVACKHITKALTMMQSVAWQALLAKRMAYQAGAAGFSDDHRGNTLFSKDEQKQANRNRKLTANQDKARGEYRKYVSRMSALAKKLKENPAKNKEMRDQLTKARKQTVRVDRENKKLKSENEKMARQIMKYKLTAVIDKAKVNGIDPKKAISAFAKQTKLSVAALNKLLKGQ